ncbi:hypothetical protein SPSIL_058290 [Sporomusa silvacetica DSM 10669]|uniref:LemA family protein n=1 Tax=Sporomusa silvacetica DSM 10669 TaxID=1123289 RepID=A0ABZ3IV44_9FIRM|nr:hypothetical protein [Sporomusa silvacetica]OZC14223.1 hypothetical protein SPSIL_49500 [Sporomusa silvacetica DSM 10669]
MSDFINFLAKEWDTLIKAPFTFALLFVGACAIAYFFSKFRYETIIAQLKERIEGYKDRLSAKDEQLNDYRQRLHLLPSTETSYSRLSNMEIKKMTLELVSKIRSFLKESNTYCTSLLMNRSYSNTMTEEDRQKAWSEETMALSLKSSEINSYYDTHFKVEAILLRDELLSRLPSGTKKEHKFSTYEHPTNPIGMGMVADDLERLAKSLLEK